MKREPFTVSPRGYSIHTEGGVIIAYAPDEDMQAARAEWRRFAHLMATAPRLANTLEEAARLVRKGDLFELKKMFQSADMQHLLTEIEKEI